MSDIICWWSGGVTSAVACKVAIDLYGTSRCRVIMIDTDNEDDDTYRFAADCQRWYQTEIEFISAIRDIDTSRRHAYGLTSPHTHIDVGRQYNSIQDVWLEWESLNIAKGAICSVEFKRKVRERWQKQNEYSHQVFGFEFDKKEFNRALGLSKIQRVNGIYPLLMMGYDKEDCIQIVQDAGIEIPRMYKLGFRNNNCFGIGCVQGGIGYWQKMKVDFPEKFDKMAEMEHELTALRGEPVTMLKDQPMAATEVVDATGLKWKRLVFLKKHPDYPELKCIDDMKVQPVQPLFDCNGFCGTDHLTGKNPTKDELFFDQTIS